MNIQAINQINNVTRSKKISNSNNLTSRNISLNQVDTVNFTGRKGDKPNFIQRLLSRFFKEEETDYERQIREKEELVEKMRKEDSALFYQLENLGYAEEDGSRSRTISDSDIADLIPMYKENKALVQELLEMNVVDEIGNTYPRFVNYMLPRMTKSLMDNSPAATKTINLKHVDEYGHENYRFGYSDIAYMDKEYNEQNKEFFEKLLNFEDRDLTGSDITLLLGTPIEEDDRELIYHFLKLKKQKTNKEEYRFSGTEVARMYAQYKNNLDALIKILDSDQEYNYSDICKFSKCVKRNPECLFNIMEEKIVYDDGVEKPKYDAIEICKIFDAKMEDESATCLLLDEKVVDEEGKIRDRFSPKEILEMVSLPEEDKNFMISLVQEKIPDGYGSYKPKFDFDTIMLYSNVYSSDPEFFGNIPRFKVEDGKKIHRDCYCLLSKEYTKEAMKKQTSDGRYINNNYYDVMAYVRRHIDRERH